jgi:predicted RNA-binding protein associated with RNAse of E/G family
METLTLYYHRPPNRIERLVQELLYADEGMLVSYYEVGNRKEPEFFEGQLVLEPGSPCIWFTFAGARYDIARFHDARGNFTGIYSDILEPVRFQNSHELTLTDLFVDVWIGSNRRPVLLDLDELREAVSKGWISLETGDAALAEAYRILALCRRDMWPPPVINEWTYERVRRTRSMREHKKS